MFLSFSVAGALVRPFMQLLQTVSKQGEGLFFEPHPHSLQLRVVNSSRSTHMLVNIDACQLEAYRLAKRGPVAKEHAGGNGTTSTGAHDAVSHENDKDDLYLLLPTKALIATVLRQSQNLCAMHIRYDAASVNDMASCDTLYWECVWSCGIVRKFSLPLAEGRPERAYFSQDQFSFDACATAKVWGALLAWFPASRPRVIMQPLHSRLEVWVVNDEALNVMGEGPQAFDYGKCGWAETKVVATQEHFLFLVQQEQGKHGEEQQDMGVTRTTGGSTDREGGKDKERAHAAATRSRGMSLPGMSLPGMSLPGKIIEVKPFKQVCLLADQLGMMIRVRTGPEGLPVFVEAITPQEARQAALSVAAATTDPFLLAKDGSAAVMQNVLGRSSAQSENMFRVTFSMYIAAFDIPHRPVENTEGLTATERYSTNSVTTTAGDERGVTATSAMHEPTGTLATVRVTPLPSDGVRHSVEVQSSAPIATGNISTAPPAHSMEFPCVTGPVMDEFSSPSRVLVSASPMPGHCRASGGSSMVPATPSHCDGRSSSSPSGGFVVKPTPNVGSTATPFSSGKRPREGEETYGNFPQQWIPGHAAVTVIPGTPASSLAALTGAPSSDHAQQQQQQQLSLESGRPSLGTRYPLDFGAFMREIAEEATEEGDESEVDEDLQRFLESCMSLVVLPATPATPETPARPSR